jgi:hypothetical protein
MNKKMKSENLFEYVLDSDNLMDFISRVNMIYNVIRIETKIKIAEETKFPFQVINVLDNMNEETNSIIRLINDSEIVMFQPKLSEEIFIEIIKLDMPDLYQEYQYYTKIINN